MISIITSFYKYSNIERLRTSLQKTIGLAFELIAINNPGTMGICEAYNKGAAKAKFDVLCFVHDDVEFITNNWHLKLLNYFKSDKNIGVIGVAGSVCKNKLPGSWWQPAVKDIEPKRINLWQTQNCCAAQVVTLFINPLNEERSLVASLDGVFLAVKKKDWEKTKFDENLLKGFHGYDLDFSLNIGRTKNNYVVYNILLEHASEGKLNMDWFKDVYAVCKKWKGLLPVSKSSVITKEILKKIDRDCIDFLFGIAAISKKEKKEKLMLYIKCLVMLGLFSITINDFKKIKILLQQVIAA